LTNKRNHFTDPKLSKGTINPLVVSLTDICSSLGWDRECVMLA